KPAPTPFSAASTLARSRRSPIATSAAPCPRTASPCLASRISPRTLTARLASSGTTRPANEPAAPTARTVLALGPFPGRSWAEAPGITFIGYSWFPAWAGWPIAGGSSCGLWIGARERSPSLALRLEAAASWSVHEQDVEVRRLLRLHKRGEHHEIVLAAACRPDAAEIHNGVGWPAEVGEQGADRGLGARVVTGEEDAA